MHQIANATCAATAGQSAMPDSFSPRPAWMSGGLRAVRGTFVPMRGQDAGNH